MNKNIKEHPTGFMKWRQKLGKTICIKDMLKFTFHHLKENKLKIFRWKLLHFILPCKQLHLCTVSMENRKHTIM